MVWIELSAGGVSGFGEATPQDHYGESVASAASFLDGAGELLGEDPFAFEEIGARLAEVPGEMAAKAAIDAALHDLCGKLCGQPFWRVLGLRRESPATSFTIGLGDPDDMARRAEQASAGGRFRRLKLKLGGRDALDVDRVQAVRGGHRTAAPGRRQRVLDARRGAGRDPAAVRHRRRLRGAAAAGRRSRRPGVEAPLHASRLRRRGLPHPGRRRRLCGARARDQHQARQERGVARGHPDGPCRPRPRAGRHGRVHGRVRPGDRPGLRRREPLRPRRSRREPAPGRGPLAGRGAGRRRPAAIGAPRARHGPSHAWDSHLPARSAR